MKKLIHIIMILAFSAISLYAQENNITPPDEDDVAVGAIEGFVDISALGGATYSIPIQVPDGIDGVQPNLSVVYNSQGGNGLLGWGWNLGGLSAITRVGQTNYHDGNTTGISFDYHDRYALDGQRLIVLDGNTYGSNGAEYKTEVDGMSKIVSYTAYGFNGPASFKVWTADGLLMEYGCANNAKVIHDNGTGLKTVVIWLLNRVEDRNGNYMVYNYIIDDVGHNYRLDNIQYCANTHVSDIGLLDRGTKYGIDFYYHRRFDVEIGFIQDYVLYQPWLLDSISVYHWSQPLYSYEFDYSADCGQANTNSKFFYNRLEHVSFRDTDGNAFYSTNITYGQIPLVNYQNTPAQGDGSFEDYCTRIHLDGSANGVSIIGNQLKFPGDFNGDGLDDFIAVDFDLSKSSDSIDADTLNRNSSSYIAVYQNKGNTLNDSENGQIDFDRIYAVGMTGQEMLPGGYYNPNLIYSIIGLKWIYVCDFNGDGLDDFVLFREMDHYVYLHAFKSRIDDDGNLTFDKVRFATTNTTTFSYDNITSRRKASFVVGDFLGRSVHDMIFLPALRWNNNPRNFLYFSFVDNAYGGFIVMEEAGCGIQGNRFVAADFNGDGRTEIWYTRDDDAIQNGQIVYIYKNSYSEEQYLFATLTGNFLTNKHTLFPGDINGDGKTDLLTYDKQTKAWECRLFKGTQCHSTVIDLSEHMISGDPGDYSNSIENRIINGINTFVQLADFNGDGKSDIVMVQFPTNTMRIGFSPHYNDDVNGWQFYWKDFISPISAGIQDQQTVLGHHTICVGNFLGRENMSMFDCYRLYSKCPTSTYYNVETITDGMGNRISFDYDYLVHNPMKSDNIYNVEHLGQNLGYDLYDIPLPMKAVKTLNSYNVNLPTQAHAVDSFSYANAVVHRKGKGLLGFTNIARDSWLIQYPTKDSQWTKHQGKLVQTYNYKPMEEHRALVPETEELYRYRDDGEEVLTASTVRCYNKGLCERDMNSQGIKVFTPLTVGVITDEYELLGERGHLRRRITENEYDGQLQVNGTINYRDIVRVTDTRQGTDAGLPAVVANCEFRTATHTEYDAILNSNNLWVPNRPHSVFTISTRSTLGYTDAKLLTVYSYDNDKPYLPKFVNTYPSGVENDNDPLAMTAYYTYYPTGKLKDESHYPVVGRSEDGFKTMYAYSPDYRFLTKKTEEYDLTHANDYETLYEYNNVYGELKTETDCNGYSTYTENPDHLGLTVRSYKRDNDANHSRIPGTETVTALRWLAGSSYQIYSQDLIAPSYFSWKRSSGSAETLIIYDAMGRELRTVSHGLPENGNDMIIYQDTQYDKWGRLYKVSEPYFRGLPLEQRKWTTYTYGDFDRVDVLYGPTYTLDNQIVEPFAQYEYDGLTTTVTTGVVDNTLTHVTRTTINVMGWTESNIEVIDENGTENETTYGYNADGSLAWAVVNGNESTKVKMQYDNAGNRIELHDPDYGTMTTHYNAFGQLQWQETPKGDRTTYHYDNLGRLDIRTETDNSNSTPVTEITTWSYSNADGSKGLLMGIVHGNTQSITYTYDPLHYNNLQEVTEELFGTEYSTSYLYGDNNFPQRVSSVTYPSGYTIEKSYDAATGSLTEIRHNNQLLWKTHNANALGQITHYEMGNGVHSYYQYDDRHFLSEQHANKNGNTIQDFGYVYDIFGNLAARTEDKFNMPNTETFTYDYLNRLKTITLNGTVSSDMDYDAHGRILSKEAEGQTMFSNAQYNTYDQLNNLKPHAISAADLADNVLYFPPLGITYTMFDKVKSLENTNGNQTIQIRYQYGYDHERILMERDVNYEKLYVGNCELITQNGNSHWNTFINGPLGVFATVTSNDNTETLRYIYKDHLGSWTTITDDVGTVLQELSFDAWGNLRAPGSWSGLYNGVLLYDRGFTGHEHLFDLGLINMNGRMYDPVMSSFLSPDNYIQSPENSQNFNRYAYCMNNPLKYTDPDGEWVQYVIGGILGGINGYSIGKAAGLNGWNLVWSTVGGAAIGAATVGIGNAVSSSCGAVLGGAAAGAAAGAGNGFINGLATNSSNLGVDVFNGAWKGLISGAVGGYVSGNLITGGTGAFLGGCAANLSGQICNYVTNENNSINWWSVGLSGLTSLGGYHAMLYQGYREGGFKNLGLKYGEYSQMIRTIQQSMRSSHEAKYIAYYDPKKEAYISISGEDNQVTSSAALYRGAKFDIHTHEKYDCNGFSDYTRAFQAGKPIEECDWHTAGQLYMLGYSNPRYLATAEGNFWMMNNCKPFAVAFPNVNSGFDISFYYVWQQQEVTSFNYSHLFHSYQYNFILRY